jgi:hypothetical protein
MARILDQEPELLQEGEEFTSLEPQEEPTEESVEAPVEEPSNAEDDLPEKYQGKDIKDIVRMHQEAEKLLGRQSSEVGELRKIVDDFVKSQIEASTSPQQKDEEIDFFSEPEKAIEAAIAKHPKIREAEEMSMAMKQQAILTKLQSSHPDFSEIIQNEKFAEWVTGSKVRSELYERADKQFDYDAADELLSSWKERQNIVQETAKVQEEDRKRQLKAASTGSTKGSGEAPSRKIYRRADIIKLMQSDPERYQALAEEIRIAYAEGRIR